MKNRTNFFMLFSILCMNSLFITAQNKLPTAEESASTVIIPVAVAYTTPLQSPSCADLSEFPIVCTPRGLHSDSDHKAASVSPKKTPSPKAKDAQEDSDFYSMTPDDHRTTPLSPKSKSKNAGDHSDFYSMTPNADHRASPLKTQGSMKILDLEGVAQVLLASYSHLEECDSTAR